VLDDEVLPDETDNQERRELLEQLEHKVLLEHLVAMELVVKKVHQEPAEKLDQKDFQAQRDSREQQELVDMLVQQDSQESEEQQENKEKRR